MGQQNSKPILAHAQVSQRQRRLIWLSSVVFASALSLPLPGKAETWVGGSRTWDSVFSWQEGTIPDGVGQVATFNSFMGVSYLVNMNGYRTLGVLNLLGAPGAGGYGFGNGLERFTD